MSDIPEIQFCKLRRTLSICPDTREGWQNLVYLDHSHGSNKDIQTLNNALRTGKFRHPRARQLAAAAKNGWTITVEDMFIPGHWVDRVREIHNMSWTLPESE